MGATNLYMPSSYGTQFNGLMKLEELQDTIFSQTITPAFANFAVEDARQYEQPYLDAPAAQVSTDGTYTSVDRTGTNDTLTISDELISAERIRNASLSGSEYDLLDNARIDHGKAIAVATDQRTFSTMKSGFTVSVQDGDMDTATNSGGTNPIIITSSNVMDTFEIGAEKIEENDADATAERFLITSPQTKRRVQAYLRGTGNMVMDSVLTEQFGTGLYGGTLVNGFDMFTSNLVPRKVVGTFSGQPSNTETVTIAGVTFTFVSSLGSTAGNVLIGADQDETLNNLVAAITGGAGAGTTYYALSTADRKTLRRGYVEAVADTGANTVTITYYRPLTVSETATNFAFGDVTEQILFGQKGIVFSRAVSALKALGDDEVVSNGGIILSKKSVENFSGVELSVSQMYGAKIWNNVTGFGGVIDIKA